MPKDLERTLRVNLYGYIYMAKHAVDNMIERRVPGCVVNISSILGMIGGAGKTFYASSRGGRHRVYRRPGTRGSPLRHQGQRHRPGLY